MSQNIIRVEPRTCFKCRYEANIANLKCPKCGRKLRTRTQVRVLGLFLTLISGLLTGFMSVLAFGIYGVIQNSGKPGATAKFTGDQNDIWLIAAVFGLVILFSLVGLVTGLWQLIFGKRNLILTYTVLGLGGILFVGGFIINKFYIEN